MEVNKKDQNENNFLFAERFNALKSLQSKETRVGCLQGQHQVDIANPKYIQKYCDAEKYQSRSFTIKQCYKIVLIIH